MNNSIIKVVAGLALAVGSTTAFADTKTETFNITATSSAACEIMPVQDHHLVVATGSTGAGQSGMFSVHCNDMLPYTLELDSFAGGYRNVVDANTGRVYQVKFVESSTGLPLGSIANGEQFNAIGNGGWQPIMYNVTFNSNFAYGRPEVGFYVGEYNVTVSYI